MICQYDEITDDHPTTRLLARRLMLRTHCNHDRIGPLWTNHDRERRKRSPEAALLRNNGRMAVLRYFLHPHRLEDRWAKHLPRLTLWFHELRIDQIRLHLRPELHDASDRNTTTTTRTIVLTPGESYLMRMKTSLMICRLVRMIIWTGPVIPWPLDPP